ncbi:putative transcriptional regulator YdeE [Sporosarcina luteola]|nr:putative transcriptional regulator YdeE [Sporosarcina luteola]
MEIKELKLDMVGTKYVAPFSEYAAIIPDKVEAFGRRKDEIPNVTNDSIIVYEPKAGDDHEIGYFYLGFITEGPVEQIPAGMEHVHVAGAFAVLDTDFDVTRMGEYYNRLVKWLYAEGYQEHPTARIVEIYTGEHDHPARLSICLPILAPNRVS